MMDSTSNQHDGPGSVGNDGRKHAEEAKDWARSALDDQKRATADEMGGMAQAAHRAAEQLESEDRGVAANYVHTAADALDRFSGTLRDGDIDSLMRQTRNFARRQPLLFFGGSIAVGFMVGRFFNSSATRSEPFDHSATASQPVSQSGSSSPTAQHEVTPDSTTTSGTGSVTSSPTTPPPGTGGLTDG